MNWKEFLMRLKPIIGNKLYFRDLENLEIKTEINHEHALMLLYNDIMLATEKDKSHYKF